MSVSITGKTINYHYGNVLHVLRVLPWRLWEWATSLNQLFCVTCASIRHYDVCPCVYPHAAEFVMQSAGYLGRWGRAPGFVPPQWGGAVDRSQIDFFCIIHSQISAFERHFAPYSLQSESLSLPASFPTESPPPRSLGERRGRGGALCMQGFNF